MTVIRVRSFVAHLSFVTQFCQAQDRFRGHTIIAEFPRFMKRSATVLGALLALLLFTVPDTATAVEPTYGEIAGAIVRVDVTIMPGAQTTQSPGKERSSSRMVIGYDGLILTIDYLIME